MSRPLLLAAVALLAPFAGCANEHREATTGRVRLSAAREPFTFSSWDVDRVEWSAPANDARAVPPNVAAVLADGSVVPVRGLTLAKAKSTPGLTVGTPAKVDDGHGDVYDNATPVTGSGFRFDFAGDRLVHVVAEPYDKAGSPVQPIFENRAADDRDANGDVRQYAMPLDHDTCVHLFGGANGLETELVLPNL